MNTNGLRKIAGHLRDYALTVTETDTEHRLHATNPLYGAEEILPHHGRCVTSYDDEVGERGHEEDCATRIAHLLAIPVRFAPALVPDLEPTR